MSDEVLSYTAHGTVSLIKELANKLIQANKILSAINHKQLGLLFLALYLVLLFPAMPVVGDAADYASSIRQGDFGTRTIHIGYNIVAFPFMVVGSWLGQSATTILNMLAAFCMAGSIAVLHQLYCSLGCARSTAALACIVFGTTGIIWYHAEFGEVQALLILLIVTSIYLFIRGQAILAGGLFGFTLLVSQAAVPTIVCFPLIAFWKRSREDFMKFGVASSLVFVVGVAPIAEDYFFGPRGVIPSMEYYPSGSLLVTIAYFVYRLVENHTIWTVWFVVGLVVSYKEMPHILVGTVVLWCSHVWLNLRLSHIEYGFAWMPFFIMSSLVIAIGAEWTYKQNFRRSKIVEVVVLLCIVLSATFSCILYVLPKRIDAISLQNVVKDTKTLLGSGTVLATPHVGFVYVYETDPAVADVWKSSWKPLPSDVSSWEKLMLGDQPIFVLLYRHHTHILRRLVVDGFIGPLFLSNAKRAQYREEGAVISEAELQASLPKNFCFIVSASWQQAELLEILANESCDGQSKTGSGI